MQIWADLRSAWRTEYKRKHGLPEYWMGDIPDPPWQLYSDYNEYHVEFAFQVDGELHGGVTVTWSARENGQLAGWYDDKGRHAWEKLRDKLAERKLIRQGISDEGDERGKRGPTVRTQERARVFKKLKDAHPTWSQARVAQEASKELGEYVTADTVRSTYRAMGWKWERADRIR